MQPRVSWPGDNSAQAVKIYLQGVLDIVFEGKDARQTMDSLTGRVEELLK
jgi:hypothetical protein